jgi:hypothetical protein
MRKLIILMLIGICTSQIQAQNEKDALRYSFLTHGGTARYVAMSGAFGALGADFSSISTNPAGLGSFRSSSIMFCPTYQMNTAKSDYLGNSSQSENAYVNLGNLGMVFNFLSSDDDSEGWKSAGLAIGYNKLMSFNQDIKISGYNERSSRLDQFKLNSDRLDIDKLNSAEFTAYDAKLTYYNSNYEYFHDYYHRYYVNQKKRILTTGGVGEYVVALGGNYNDVLQIGISMGYQIINYTEKSTFSESSDSTILIDYDFTENIHTRGSGMNLKLGMIYRPVEFLRLGLAFHTPTFYSLNDVYSYEINSNFDTEIEGSKKHSSDGDGEMEYAYELYTPMRIVASSAIVLPKIGIISADYEYVNYQNARLRADDYEFDPENDSIKSMYKAGHTFRLGAEIKLSPLFLRGGVSYYGSPDKAGNISGTTGFSFGAGIRTKGSFVDFGFNHSSSNLNYRLYDYENGTETTDLKFNNNTFCLTVGFVF